MLKQIIYTVKNNIWITPAVMNYWSVKDSKSLIKKFRKWQVDRVII
jgi:hypothetical protein